MAVITATHKTREYTYASDGVTSFTQNAPTEHYGKVRCDWFYWKPTVAVAAAETVSLAYIPKGARILRILAYSNAFVATADLEIGLVGADATGIIDNATDATSDNTTMFGTAADVATAGEYTFANTIALNHGYLTQKACILTGALQIAGMDGSADILTGYVLYVVD